MENGNSVTVTTDRFYIIDQGANVVLQANLGESFIAWKSKKPIDLSKIYDKAKKELADRGKPIK